MYTLLQENTKTIFLGDFFSINISLLSNTGSPVLFEIYLLIKGDIRFPSAPNWTFQSNCECLLPH